MRTGVEHTAADAERALRALQRDPAAVGYALWLRAKGLLPPAPVKVGQ